jgi:hypothetical protein
MASKVRVWTLENAYWSAGGPAFFTLHIHESIIVLTHQKDYDGWREVPHGNSDGTSDDQ